MIRAFTLAFDQLSDPPVRRVIWRSIAGTILIFAGLLAGIGWALANTSFFDIGWLETATDLFGGLTATLLALILFPGVVTAIVSIFLEDVAAAVEARHYPDLGPARTIGWGETIWGAVRLIILTVVLNLLFLPLYFVPVVNLLVYYGLNGYLISREYFEVAGLRRLSDGAVKDLRRRYRVRVWMSGAVTTFLLTIPIVNLVAPVLGTAAMVHLFHKLNGGRT